MLSACDNVVINNILDCRLEIIIQMPLHGVTYTCVPCCMQKTFAPSRHARVIGIRTADSSLSLLPTQSRQIPILLGTEASL